MFLVVFVTSSCDDKTKEEVADRIVLSRSSVAFSEQGGTTTVTVASPSDWDAACADGWVMLHRENGALTITAGDNDTPSPRTATVTVESSSDKHEIEVRQAYSRESVNLTLTGIQKIEFDSEGESNTFTVNTNGEWSAKSEAKWLAVSCDPQRNTVTVSAAKNDEASRSATLVVTSTRGTASESVEVAVSQISREESPYNKLLGYYGLFAKNWYYGGSPLGLSGTGTFCTIEEKEYRKSVYIKDLFLDGTVVEALFNREDGTLDIELGKLCLTQDLTPSTKRYIYLTKLNMGTGSFRGGALRATPGKGADDDGQIKDALLLSGFGEGYNSLGLTVYQNQQYASFSDRYYANGEMYLVRWERPSTETAVSNAKVTPSQEGFSAYNY